MFLHGLNQEESMVFMNLANIAMKVDGEISEEELEVLDTYANECFLSDFSPSESDLDVLLDKVVNIDIIKRRVILVELVGIWSADNIWHENEVSMMYYIGDKLGLSKKEIESLKAWSTKMKETIEEGYTVLEGAI